MKRDQSKFKHCRDNWRKENPEYAKEYYEKKKLDPVFKEKALIRAKEWQNKNKEKAYENNLKYRQKNREKLQKATNTWFIENKEKFLENRRIRYKERKLNDPVYKMVENLRVLICQSFKRGKRIYTKKNKTETILGCTFNEFIDHILSKCPEGVTLKDFGQFGYHIDHIIPLSSAQTEEDVIKLNHYTNLQPLWWRDNIIKSNKI